MTATTAVAAPISSLQDTLAQTLGQGPLAPLATILSWVLDAVEVGVDGTTALLSFLLWPILTPLKCILNRVVFPFLSVVGIIITDPKGQGTNILTHTFHLLTAAVATITSRVGEGLSAYVQGVLALVLTTLTVTYRFFANLIGLFLNAPALQYLDSMDPRRHIPSTPTKYTVAHSLTLPSNTFTLKQMYGRRWTVHAGKWNWAIPFWEKVVMESQLARYTNTYNKSVIKARFGFPEIVRGPSPMVGGTLLVLAGIYLLYRGHMTSAMWIRQLQSETYGKQTWNPVTRLEEEEGGEEEGEGGKKGE